MAHKQMFLYAVIIFVTLVQVEAQKKCYCPVICNDEGETKTTWQQIFPLPGCTNPDKANCGSCPAGPVGAKGEKGDQGPNGLPGLKGERGNRGESGSLGIQGPRGDVGVKGEAGNPGAQGGKGEPGNVGAVGMKGTKGEPGVAGAKGTEGEPGVPGSPGINGLKGEPGSPGINVTKGEPGSPGINGAKGEPGSPGINGTKGEPGSPGMNVTKGEPGSAGLNGTKGEPGSPGINGAKGEPGSAGKNGTKGEPGILNDTVAENLRQENLFLTDTINQLRVELAKMSGWYMAANGLFYKHELTEETWETAKELCERMASRLASTGIRNATIRDELMKKIIQPSGKTTYFGLNARANNASWFWSDGQIDSEEDIDAWDSGEPNGENEYCVEIRVSNARLNDMSCSSKRSYLCEKDF